jgi:hypothetical protein
MTDKADELETITLYNPFLMLDFISPVCEKEFDKDLLRYIDKETTEYTDGVFVFDVKEVRIKYFHEYMTLIRKGKRDEMTTTLKIVFTDNSELLCRQSMDSFIADFLPDYVIKLHECYPEIEEENKQNVR